jgi:hypothetical protein
MSEILLKKNNHDHERQPVKLFLLCFESAGPSQLPYQSISLGYNMR